MIRIMRFTTTWGGKEWLVTGGPWKEAQHVRAMPLKHFMRHPVRSLSYLVDSGTARVLGPPDFTWSEVWLFVLAVDMAAAGIFLFVRWALGPLL